MPKHLLRTPLIAAFFYGATLTACTEARTTPQRGYEKCTLTTTPIAIIQGNSFVSPLLDQQVSVQGVVTLVQDGQGLYMEEPDSDMDSGTSNAIFVQSTELPDDVRPGAWISVRGNVSEIRKGRDTLTALTDR